MEEIKIENLSFKYPTEKDFALFDISFSIKKGEFVLICGSSGSGKSTLLRKLKPSLSPFGETKGEIYINGKKAEDLSQKEQAEKIGFVFQNPENQIVCDKVWHELSFSLENLGYDKKEIRSRVAEMTAYFKIEDKFYSNTFNLSGGEKQLLNLASVMVLNPEILILDEPLSQLDPITAKEFLETLVKINKELGTTIVLSEHRLEDVFEIADKILVLERGKSLIFDGKERVSEFLFKTKNDMFPALPTPIKIFFAAGESGSLPLTVKEGREWLEKKEKKEIELNVTPFEFKEKVVELKDVWFRYEKNEKDILKGLNFEIFKSEIYAVVGGNGKGKSTLASIIANIKTPYRGKVKTFNNKIIMLPQNPRNLFVEKTVELNLKFISDNDGEIKSISEFCGIENLLQKHPFDLSGGEQQKVALGMVLLTKPDVLILDEPTKGIDNIFKSKLAGTLKELKNKGISIIIVSHDVEFCAKNADVTGMLFDGEIVSQDISKVFFNNKSFYTTVANKMARNIINNAVLEEDILRSLGIKGEKENE